ncbi:MAG: hypothetical protein LUG89_03125 [Methanosphaera sp.]|nr:hypothetical protein [Methanosphaera sp.]
MKSFNMHVKIVIISEHGKILLLKERNTGRRPLWDLPGSDLTDEESFDEAVMNQVPKDIGFFAYPGQIIGTTLHKTRNGNHLYVIMESHTRNSDIILSEKYDSYVWINIERIGEYPLVPWLNNYIKHEENPFEDVTIALQEMDIKEGYKQDVIEENMDNYTESITSMIPSFDDITGRISLDDNESQESPNQKEESSSKGSFGLLKDVINRTLHPREAEVTHNQPKERIYPETPSINEEELEEQLNFKFKNSDDDIIITHDAYDDDIIIDHSEDDINKNPDDILLESLDNNSDSLLVNSDVFDSDDDIIIDHSEDEVIIEDQIVTDEVVQSDEKIAQKSTEERKIKGFNMNVNSDQNMKKQEPLIIKSEPKQDTEPRKPATEKDDKKVSWKERLDNFSRTDANEERTVPKPKGKR